MAWSIPTYDGVAAHGRPSNLRVAMFELIRAIDERVAAYSGEPSDYTWWVAGAPHQKIAPTFDELEFLKCTGNKTGGSTANANKAYRNMALIRDRIRTQLTLGRFTTESGGDAAYTIESMETAIGRGLDLPVSVTEASWWQAMQDALDRMIYCRKQFTQTGDGGLSSTHSYIADTFPETAGNYIVNSAGRDDSEDSWDNRAEESGPIDAYSIIPSSALGWSIRNHQTAFGGPPTFIFAWYVSHQINSAITDAVFNTATAQGVPTVAKFSCAGTFINTGITTIDVDVAGTVETIGSSPVDVYIDESLVTLGSDTLVDFSIASTEPDSNPFTELQGQATFGVLSFVVCFDIAHLLSDQA